MQIVFNIAEDSNVELVKGEYELVQGECCVTELKFNFPATIKGVAIDNYKKRIEFGECKDLGECVKFVDDINGDIYELGEYCTAFKKIMVQVVLTYNNIKWKSIPVVLEFHESVNAEGNTVIQAQLLNLATIEREWQDEMTATKTAWESFIKANTLRMIHRAGDVPTADASSLGDTIFYLGANTDTAPLLVYGHYYKCNYANGVYEWTDLTQDQSLAGVADGIREINKNQTLQVWVGTAAELENEVPQENVAYIAEDAELRDVILEVIPKYPKAENAEQAYKLYGRVTEYNVMRSNESPYPYYTDTINKRGLYVIRYCDQNKGYEGTQQAFLLLLDISATVRSSESNIFYNADAQRIETASQAQRMEAVYRIDGLFEELYANIAIGNELGSYDGYARHEMWVVEGRVKVGDKLSYMGEEAEVVEVMEEGDGYVILCATTGNFAAASGKTISVEVVA